jgi:hypothetical protein
MVLESRQKCAGGNASDDHKKASTETVLAAPKQNSELSHQRDVTEIDQFQQVYQTTGFYEAKEEQPETNSQKLSIVTDTETKLHLESDGSDN